MSYQKSKDCRIHCSTDVALDIPNTPHVTCKEISKHTSDFDFEVDFKVNPRCQITPIKNSCKNKNPCVTSCAFNVKLDFECEPVVICKPCHKHYATYKVDVLIDAAPQCTSAKAQGGCGGCDHSKKEKKSKGDFVL